MSVSNDELAQWAASFLALCEETPPLLGTTERVLPSDAALVPSPLSAAITPAAHALLDAVDRGGVPAFMTSALKQIALDNGIALSAQSTPNHIIEALREKCIDRATSAPRNFE